jgi:hypothetical protein
MFIISILAEHRFAFSNPECRRPVLGYQERWQVCSVPFADKVPYLNVVILSVFPLRTELSGIGVADFSVGARRLFCGDLQGCQGDWKMFSIP